MSHSSWCPSDNEARYKAERDARFDAEYGHRRYRSPWDGECDDAAETYREAYGREWRHQEALAEERQAEERAYQRRAEEQAYWEEQERQQYEAQQHEQQTMEEPSPDASEIPF